MADSEERVFIEFQSHGAEKVAGDFESVSTAATGMGVKTAAGAGNVRSGLMSIGTVAGLINPQLGSFIGVISRSKIALDGMAGAMANVAVAGRAMLAAIFNPVTLAIAGVLLAIKLAYDRMAESAERAARAESRANEQRRVAQAIMDKRAESERRRIDLLAPVEEELIKRGLPTHMAPNLLRIAGEASQQVLVSMEQAIQAGLMVLQGTGELTTGGLVTAIQGAYPKTMTIPEGSALQQQRQRMHLERMGDVFPSQQDVRSQSRGLVRSMEYDVAVAQAQLQRLRDTAAGRDLPFWTMFIPGLPELLLETTGFGEAQEYAESLIPNQQKVIQNLGRRLSLQEAAEDSWVPARQIPLRTSAYRPPATSRPSADSSAWNRRGKTFVKPGEGDEAVWVGREGSQINNSIIYMAGNPFMIPAPYAY